VPPPNRRPPTKRKLMEDAETLRKELEHIKFGAPDQTSAVYNTP